MLWKQWHISHVTLKNIGDGLIASGYDEIKKFNNFLLSYVNTDINYLIEPLSLLKSIPIEIIYKYWTRV